MKRPILIVLIGYIIGIIWELYLEISIAPFLIIIIITYICIVTLQYNQNKKSKSKNKTCIKFLNIMIIVIISILISNTITKYLNNKYEYIYRTQLEENTYIATVISDKKEKDYNNSYTIKLETIDGNDKYKNIKLILTISKKYDLKYGDKIRFNGTYNAPQKQRNYRGFDYSEYLKTLKIYGIVNRK